MQTQLLFDFDNNSNNGKQNETEANSSNVQPAELEATPQPEASSVPESEPTVEQPVEATPTAEPEAPTAGSETTFAESETTPAVSDIDSEPMPTFVDDTIDEPTKPTIPDDINNDIVKTEEVAPYGRKRNHTNNPPEKAPRPTTIYQPDEVMASTTEYFGGDTLAASVWMNKYALRDDQNIYELNPDMMHHRLAREFARIEQRYPNAMSEETIYQMLKDFRYLVPQGSPMSGIGNDFQVLSLSNCFVIGNQGAADSYGGVMKIDQEQVQLMKRRGGVGHDLSHIRPYGTPVKNCALTSTGIVPFMERYSNTTREVAQGGRRGALMLSISIKHPDAEQFIDAKLAQDKITGANISVKITDEFMRCVKNGTPFVQQYPIDSDNPTVRREIDARALWNKIIANAWSSAEPGVLFWDTILRESVPDCYGDFGFTTVSTNPCGEIPLCPYDSCRLMAINLYSYVENPFTPQASFNFDLFADHVAKGQRLMDDLIDLELEKIDQILAKIENDPEDEELKHVERNLWLNIKMKCMEGRRTGLGITAEGDMLAALGLRYGTDEATDFAVRVHNVLACSAYRSSVVMAEERGVFPLYNASREENNPFIQRIADADPALYDDMRRVGRRNIALLTIAPTGSVSILTRTTSGIEPVFLVAYKRRKKINPNDRETSSHKVIKDESGDYFEEYNVLHPKFVEWLRVAGYNVEEVMNMDANQLDVVVDKSPYRGATSADIDWVSKVRMQGAIQKWVDHSISVTVNVPKETSKDVVSTIYMTAWESGCKGCTIYRDGSRTGVLVSTKENNGDSRHFTETKAPKRPTTLEAEIVRFKNEREDWVAVVGMYEGRPYEIFTGRAESFVLPQWVERGWVIRHKEEGDAHARYDFQFLDRDGYHITIEGLSRMFNKEYWNYAKLISGVLRHGMPIANVVDLIGKLNFDVDSITTWSNGVARALRRFIKDGTETSETCPDCGAKLVYNSGCKSCPDCGWSKCE